MMYYTAFAYPTSELTVKTATVIQPSVVFPIVYNDSTK